MLDMLDSIATIIAFVLGLVLVVQVLRASRQR